MRFNSQGHAVMGVGDAVVSVDNVAIPGSPVSGEAAWIDDGQIGYRYRGSDGVYRLGRWVIGTPTTDILDLESATTFRGGGDVWAAFLVGPGVRTNSGLTFPEANLCDVSAAGSIVLCPNYQLGRNLMIRDWHGAEIWLGTGALGADATQGPNVRLRGGLLLYQADNAWHLQDVRSGPLPFVPRAVPINYAVPVGVGDEDYLLEREASRLTLRKATETRGWVVAHGDTLWGPDAVQVTPGAILIGWCGNASETPGSLVTMSQSFDAPMVELDPPVTPSEPPTSPIVSFPGYTFSARSYGRRGLCGPAKATNLRNGNFVTPGNTEYLDDGTVDVGNQQVDRPFLVTLQSSHCTVDKTIGLFAVANDDSPGNRGIKGVYQWYREKGRKAHLIRYYDGSDIPQQFIDACEPEAIVMPQCRPLDNETAAQSLVRFRANMTRVVRTGRNAGIMRALNVKYGGPNTALFADRVKRVLDVQSGLCDIVRDYEKCVADFWFSWGRYAFINGQVVDCGAAYVAEFQTVANVLGGLFTGLL